MSARLKCENDELTHSAKNICLTVPLRFELNGFCLATIFWTSYTNDSKKDVPLTKESSTTQIIECNDLNVDIEYLIKKEPEKYIYTPIPKDYLSLVHCTVKYNKEGLMSKTFSLYFDGQNENDRTFLLTARKHLKIDGHSEYFIGNDEKSLKNLNDENSIAKLKGINLTGTEYVFYNQNNQQSVAIIYNTHIFGSKEPRNITVLLYNVEKPIHPLKENETIIGEWRAGHATDLIEIKNKTPVYNKESKVYSLELLENRVKQPSHKNFQLLITNGDREEDIIMQFGRIDDNNFALDYRYPLTAMQAFAIALSSFHNRFRT
ncbi:unnamed protein product [Rotaria sp. Silwood1]|nr:unnamed protein product [Rotaria sp. Silwood1]